MSAGHILLVLGTTRTNRRRVSFASTPSISKQGNVIGSPPAPVMISLQKIFVHIQLGKRSHPIGSSRRSYPPSDVGFSVSTF